MFDGMLQIVHPDRVVDEAGFANMPQIEPVYPLTEGLMLGALRRAIALALPKVPQLPEWIGADVIRRTKLPVFRRGADARSHPATAGRHPARQAVLAAARL